MKLIVSYKSPTMPMEDRQILMAIELPQGIADDLANNRNTQLEHKFVIELASTRYIGSIVAPVGGLR